MGNKYSSFFLCGSAVKRVLIVKITAKLTIKSLKRKVKNSKVKKVSKAGLEVLADAGGFYFWPFQPKSPVLYLLPMI